MKHIFNPGDKKQHHFKVEEKDFPMFDNVVVHKVCSTYALAREIEWTSRKFVLEMMENDEEGIGTRLEIEHKAPALSGEIIEIEAVVDNIKGNELICTFTAFSGIKTVAKGLTGQKILKKEKFNQLLIK